MTYAIRLHPFTRHDYYEAYEWYENKQTGLGERFMQAVRKKIEEISLQPETFSSKDNKNYREAKTDTFPFIIVYKISKQKKEIYISSIHHAKKHPGKNTVNNYFSCQ